MHETSKKVSSKACLQATGNSFYANENKICVCENASIIGLCLHMKSPGYVGIRLSYTETFEE